MKRALTVIQVLALCLLLAVSAFADVIWEPEDDFYQKHRDECHYEDRVYIAAGEAGYASVYKDPKAKKAKEELPNGTEFWVSYVWEGDGDGAWGLGLNTRWVRMDELTVKYDGISFSAEHGSEFLYLDEWEFLDLTGCDCLHLWRYPGDAEPFTTLSGSGEDAWWGWPPEELSFNIIYEDPEGRRWGYVNYYYGLRDFWVCLTDPDDASIGGGELPQPTAEPAPVNTTPAPTAAPSTPAPTAAPTAAPTPEVPIVDPEPPKPFPWLPAGLAAGAVVIAGALLAVFRKKK